MAIRLLTELLLKNDDNFTWLSLTNNEIGVPIPELTQALLANHTLRKVSCHAGFLGSLSLPDLVLLMDTLAQLPHNSDLWLALPPRQAARSSLILRSILLSPTAATKCRLQKLTLRGTDDAGCCVLAAALCQPTACMTDLQIRGTSAGSTTSGINGNQQPNINNNMNQQPNNNNIIWADNNNNNNDAAAPTNNTTQPQPQSKVTRQGILAVAEMLKVNRSLERVDLCYKGLDSTSCQAVAEALLVNHKLQKLDLTSPSTFNTSNNNITPTNNHMPNELVRTNNNNTNTKKKESLTKGWDALVDTMRENYTLHHLNTQAEGDQKYMLDLLTRLNRTGARAMMRNATDHTGLEDVLEVLLENDNYNPKGGGSSISSTTSNCNTTNNNNNNNSTTTRCARDVTATYELLSLNPSLWDPARATVKDLEPKHRKDQKKQRRNSLVQKKNNETPEDLMAANQHFPDAADNKKKVKPVMARWSENIFSTMEREKIRNFKRWTPTVIEESSSVSATTTSTSDSVGAADVEQEDHRPEGPVPEALTRSWSVLRLLNKKNQAIPEVAPPLQSETSSHSSDTQDNTAALSPSELELSTAESEIETVESATATSKEDAPAEGLASAVKEESPKEEDENRTSLVVQQDADDSGNDETNVCCMIISSCEELKPAAQASLHKELLPAMMVDATAAIVPEAISETEKEKECSGTCQEMDNSVQEKTTPDVASIPQGSSFLPEEPEPTSSNDKESTLDASDSQAEIVGSDAPSTDLSSSPEQGEKSQTIEGSAEQCLDQLVVVEKEPEVASEAAIREDERLAQEDLERDAAPEAEQERLAQLALERLPGVEQLAPVALAEGEGAENSEGEMLAHDAQRQQEIEREATKNADEHIAQEALERQQELEREAARRAEEEQLAAQKAKEERLPQEALERQLELEREDARKSEEEQLAAQKAKEERLPQEALERQLELEREAARRAEEERLLELEREAAKKAKEEMLVQLALEKKRELEMEAARKAEEEWLAQLVLERQELLARECARKAEEEKLAQLVLENGEDHLYEFAWTEELTSFEDIDEQSCDERMDIFTENNVDESFEDGELDTFSEYLEEYKLAGDVRSPGTLRSSEFLDADNAITLNSSKGRDIDMTNETGDDQPTSSRTSVAFAMMGGDLLRSFWAGFRQD